MRWARWLIVVAYTVGGYRLARWVVERVDLWMRRRWLDRVVRAARRGGGW